MYQHAMYQYTIYNTPNYIQTQAEMLPDPVPNMTVQYRYASLQGYARICGDACMWE